MADNPKQGRWDHLLREIPTKTTTQPKPPPPVPKVEEVPKEEPEEQIYSVSDVNRAIKKQLEGNFTHIWVQGEISNFKAHSSGHYYFSLKDDKAQINAVMFKGFNSRLKFRPESGMEVIARGRITVYEPRGNYQIFCESMEPVGAGALQKAFEQLKEKLKTEGLFDNDKKQPIPSHPVKVGVVTSPTGAAIQDILNVLRRRSKRVQVTVIPARVQGDVAAKEVVRGIELANQIQDFDVLIVGRGGGSIEDLWCFNEEIVARAIFASKIPIISAVGHEVDFTIADFVADLRAPTPSAAAELVAKSELELQEKIKFYSKSLRLLFFQMIADRRQRLEHSQKRLLDPRKYVQDAMMRLDDWSLRLQQSITRLFENRRMKVKMAQQSIKSPLTIIEQKQTLRKNLTKLIGVAMNQHLVKLQNRFQRNTSLLDSLSPLRVVDRGYALVRQDKNLVADVEQLKSGPIEIELRDGFIEAEVKNVTKKEKE